DPRRRARICGPLTALSWEILLSGVTSRPEVDGLLGCHCVPEPDPSPSTDRALSLLPDLFSGTISTKGRCFGGLNTNFRSRKSQWVRITSGHPPPRNRTEA